MPALRCLVASSPARLAGASTLRASSAPLRTATTTGSASSPCTAMAPASRAFSTSSPLARQTPSYLTVPKDAVPEYPYGEFQTYKQRNKGLYGGAKIRFGNTISKKYDRKSRVSWLPNRKTKRLWSVGLQSFIRTRLTVRVLRTLDKLGGIDEYLLGSKSARLRELGPAGWALRWKLIQSPRIQERFAKERAELGLPPKTQPAIDASTAEALEAAIAQEFGIDGDSAGAQRVRDAVGQVDGMIERDEEFVLGEPEEKAPTARS